jgi:DNA-binding IclR family transcriptional regulator
VVQPREAGRGPSQPVQSVDRALQLLAAVAGADHEPSVAELAAQVGLNRSTAWRLLATLEAHGMVERAPRSTGFRVGYGAWRLGAAADVDSLVRRIQPTLHDLADEVGETVSLAVVKAMSLVYVTHVPAPPHGAHLPAAFQPWTQDRVSLHSTSSGKIFLAWLGEDERRGALPATLERFTDATITAPDALEEELARARRLGYATCTGEDAAFTNGVSAAVRDARGRPIAVLNIWGPERRIPVDRFGELGPAAVRAAAEIATLLA